MLSLLMFFLALVSILIIRRLLMLFPGFYFSIQDIVTTDSKDLNLLGFTLRFAVVLLFSLLVLFITNRSVLHLVEYSFYLSFLLIWPFIMDKIILYNRRQENTPGFMSRQPGMVKKYLLVYLMYSLLSLGVSFLALPVFDLVHNTPSSLYQAFLRSYVSWDPFVQNIFSNSFSAIALSGVILLLRQLYRLLLRRKN